MMKFEALPFVKCDESGRVVDTWAVKQGSDQSENCALGRQYFRSLLMLMHITGNMLLLSRVIEGQAKKYGDWGGIEVGFHAAMSDELAVVD